MPLWPLLTLAHLQQLYPEVLHGLQGTVQFGLITESSYQSWAVDGLLNMQAKRLQRCNQRIRQFSAYADLVGLALSATGHDRTAAD